MKRKTKAWSCAVCAVCMALAMTGCGGTESSVPASDSAVSSAVQAASSLPASQPESQPEEEVFDPAQFMEEVAPAIEFLRTCDAEMYGADVDFDTHLYAAVTMENGAAQLAALYPAGGSVPDGLQDDPSCSDYYPVRNYTTIAQVQEGIEEYMAGEQAQKFSLDGAFKEHDGKLYLYRGARGYGILQCDPASAEYLGEEDGKQLVTVDYLFNGEYSHQSVLTFEQIDGSWKITSVQDQ